jgi:hypothetical protein
MAQTLEIKKRIHKYLIDNNYIEQIDPYIDIDIIEINDINLLDDNSDIFTYWKNENIPKPSITLLKSYDESSLDNNINNFNKISFLRKVKDSAFSENNLKYLALFKIASELLRLEYKIDGKLTEPTNEELDAYVLKVFGLS